MYTPTCVVGGLVVEARGRVVLQLAVGGPVLCVPVLLAAAAGCFLLPGAVAPAAR